VATRKTKNGAELDRTILPSPSPKFGGEHEPDHEAGLRIALDED